MINYDNYVFTKNELIKYFTIGYLAIFAISYLFYANLFLSIIVGFLACLYLKVQKVKIIKMRKRELTLQFKDALYLLASSLSAGYSVENAFKKTKDELKELYLGQDTLIIRELELIVQNLNINKSIEATLLYFSKRANIEDISNFVEVFITCKNTGGNLNEVIKNTSITINEKIDIEEEIALLVTKKKLEQNIISIMPVGIMLMLVIASRDYITPLYNTFMGNLVVTIAIMMTIFAIIIGNHIMKIEV